MDLQSIRKEYQDHGIDQDQLDDCPVAQFQSWYDDAFQKRPGEWFECNAMALATADRSGRVSVRYVLLKRIQPDGLYFFTNYDSIKGQQLDENPNCSVALHWPYLGRQVRIDGRTKKTSRELSDQYFHQRPRGAQIGASISKQSWKIGSRAELEHKFQSLEQQLGDKVVPLPDNWGGYLIEPNRFEFWQGRLDRLHDRILYQKNAQNEWVRYRLCP